MNDPAIRELAVLWQHPDTGQVTEIGHLTYDGDVFAFEYTAAARAIPDFRPLPGLPLGQRYENALMPAVFAQRAMNPTRTTATPWDQLTGQRVNDNLLLTPCNTS